MSLIHLTDEAALSRCRQNVFAFTMFFIMIVLTYSNTFNATWHFDDVPNILERKDLHMTKLSWPQIKRTFSDRKSRLFHRPVARLSFALNYYVSQDDPFGYHLVNTAVHLITACFLFLLIFHTLRLPGMPVSLRSNAYSLALLSAFFWAVNPIQTQAVTYVVQRMASMAAMFYVAAMFFYLKARTAQGGPRSWLFFGLCGLAALLAFGCKENAAMLPFSLLLYDVLLIQGLSKRSVKRGLLMLLLLSLVPAGLLLLLKGPSFFDPMHLIQSYGHRGFTLGARLMTETRIVLIYISLLLYPMPNRLCLVHEIDVSKGLLQPPTTLFSLVAIVLIVSVAISKSRKYPLVSFCVLFFFLNHLIESSVFSLELFYEHRNYLPSLFFFLPISILMYQGIAYFTYNKTMKLIFCGFIVSILIGYGHSTRVRNMIWKTEISLWLDAIDKNPNSSRAYHNLGMAYGELNQLKKAILYYDKAIQLPMDNHGKTNHLTHHNLGNIHMKLGNDDTAIYHLNKSIEIEPSSPYPHITVSILFAKKEEYDESYKHLIHALTLDPSNAKAHNNLGFIMLKQDRFPEALSEFHKALKSDKNYLPAIRNLGITYRYTGKINKSIEYLARALKREPQSILTSLHLAESYLHQGNQEKAEQTVQGVVSHQSISKLQSNWSSALKKSTLVILPDMERLFPVVRNVLEGERETLRKIIQNMGPHT